MDRLRSLLSIWAAAAASLAALGAVPSTANAADVYVYRRPAYVAGHVVRVGPHCTVRRTRVWTGYRYIYRTVRRCY